MFSMFLSSYRNTCESLGELEKAVETLTCGSCSHSISCSPKLPLVFLKLDRNTPPVFYFLSITSNLPIIHHVYVALIVLAPLFSMAWCKIVIQCSLVVYHGISHSSLVFSWYTQSPKGLCVYQENSRIFHLIIY